jgi:MFS family permease
MILAAATIYGLGKSFLWPTSLGFVSEQFPKGGAVTLNVVGAVGMLAVGVAGSVMLGSIQDHATEKALAAHDQRAGTAWSTALLGEERGSIFGSYRGVDPRALAATDAGTRAAVLELIATSKKQALRTVAILPVVMLATYLALLGYFRLRGGYRPTTLPARPL